ncbi:CBS domain-containing protein [Thermovirga sp.]|uniref:CBS domain-containing protein n=1 Tax=Thermovirga sp. TaxID=2699834 RepID=UPI0025ECF114|nr:CBS domain-containing protein [Thermovirga sp.]MBO8153954.1 CBS domain-containing protein [Thermovirga sp.]
MRIGELMDRDLTALFPDTTIAEAVEVLSTHRVSGLPVADQEGHLVGFISEKDIIRAALPGYFDFLKDPSFLPDFGQFGKRLLKISNDPVEKYMVKKVIAFDENDSDFQVAMMMMKSNLKRAPILSDGIFVGMVSRADLLDHILRSAKEEVDSNFYK